MAASEANSPQRPAYDSLMSDVCITLVVKAGNFCLQFMSLCPLGAGVSWGRLRWRTSSIYRGHHDADAVIKWE